MKNLIFNAYCSIQDFNGSVNIKNKENLEIYMKNVCVSLFSAKINNPNDEVALITNIDVPGKYKLFLEQNMISIKKCEFDNFTFPKDYKWSLAFYKLCALKYAIEELNYDNYILLDTDTVTIKSYSNIWKECRDKIMLLDINHSLDIKQIIKMNQEYKELYNKDIMITNYGGEFIATNKENGLIWIEKCEKVYEKIKEQNLITSHGDEFIVCSVAYQNPILIKNAGAYIFRYWTGKFYLVSTNYYYNQISILHLPNEKESGMIELFNYVFKKNQMPHLKKIKKIFNLPDSRGKYKIVRKVIKVIRRNLEKCKEN